MNEGLSTTLASDYRHGDAPHPSDLEQWKAWADGTEPCTEVELRGALAAAVAACREGESGMVMARKRHRSREAEVEEAYDDAIRALERIRDAGVGPSP